MNRNYKVKWIIQRVTAVILIPSTFWFIYNCLSFQYLQYNDLVLFFQSFLNSSLFLLMMISMLIHAKLGCETIIEDYIYNNSIKNFSKFMINIVTFFSALFVVISIIAINI